MTYLATITSQGQISIPVKLRRKFGLDQKSVLVSEEDGKIIIEPIKDFLELGGSLKTAIKATPTQVRQAFGDYLAREAVKDNLK